MSPGDPPLTILAAGRAARIDRGDEPPPPDWVSRALYPGDAGARHWLAVVTEPGYPLRDPDCLNLRANRCAALAGRRAATLVSLGPGDGRHDLPLLDALRGPDPGPLPRYVPVDLCRGLLETAAATVRGHATIPAALLCDFEDEQPFLAQALQQHARPPVLFALLGGTVGNLDRGEGAFFAGFRRLMGPDDLFLLDLPLAGPAWSAAREPRLSPTAYSAAFRDFLAPGLDRPGSTPSGPLPFEQRVAFSLGHDDATGAEVVTVLDRAGGRPVLAFRRYRWEPMLRWLQGHGFTVAFARSSLTADQDRFGMGVVLLTPGPTLAPSPAPSPAPEPLTAPTVPEAR